MCVRDTAHARNMKDSMTYAYDGFNELAVSSGLLKWGLDSGSGMRPKYHRRIELGTTCKYRYYYLRFIWNVIVRVITPYLIRDKSWRESFTIIRRCKYGKIIKPFYCVHQIFLSRQNFVPACHSHGEPTVKETGPGSSTILVMSVCFHFI